MAQPLDSRRTTEHPRLKRRRNGDEPEAKTAADTGRATRLLPDTAG